VEAHTLPEENVDHPALTETEHLQAGALVSAGVLVSVALVPSPPLSLQLETDHAISGDFHRTCSEDPVRQAAVCTAAVVKPLEIEASPPRSVTGIARRACPRTPVTVVSRCPSSLHGWHSVCQEEPAATSGTTEGDVALTATSEPNMTPRSLWPVPSP